MENQTLILSLLQVKVLDGYLNLYFSSSNKFPDNVDLNVTILISNTKSSRILDEEIEINIILSKIRHISNSNNEEILQFSQYNNDLYAYMNQNKENNIRIVVDKIELLGSENEINYNELYNLKVNLGDRADTTKQSDIDFSSILMANENNENFDLNIYTVQGISTCSHDYKFNLTLDKNIKGDEEKINLIFQRKSRSRNFELIAECTLSYKYNNLILCKVDIEVPNFNFTLSPYMNYNENNTKLTIISPENDSDLFLLYCYENPPIAAIIFIPSMFVFVVIVVIVIIIFLNKKGRGEKGYEPTNNSNDLIGLSSGAISK